MRVSIFLISIIIVLIACQEQSVMEDQAYKYRTPSFFPKPTIPQDNQATIARIELGRRLFFEKKLSRTELMSCATCHVPSMAFTDGKVYDATGQLCAHATGTFKYVKRTPSVTSPISTD